MDHNFEHLPLPLVLSGKPKLRGGVHPSNRTNQNRANRTIHGGNLKRRSSELSQFWKERQQSRADAHLPHFEIGIPILLEIDPNSDLSFLKGLGFEIISENPSGYIIVATEDVDMSILNQKVDNFIANMANFPSYCTINELGSIEVKGYSNSSVFTFPYAMYPGYL